MRQFLFLLGFLCLVHLATAQWGYGYPYGGYGGYGGYGYGMSPWRMRRMMWRQAMMGGYGYPYGGYGYYGK